MACPSKEVSYWYVQVSFGSTARRPGKRMTWQKRRLCVSIPRGNFLLDRECNVRLSWRMFLKEHNSVKQHKQSLNLVFSSFQYFNYIHPSPLNSKEPNLTFFGNISSRETHCSNLYIDDIRYDLRSSRGSLSCKRQFSNSCKLALLSLGFFTHDHQQEKRQTESILKEGRKQMVIRRLST